jgi:hypothetical protein
MVKIKDIMDEEPLKPIPFEEDLPKKEIKSVKKKEKSVKKKEKPVEKEEKPVEKEEKPVEKEEKSIEKEEKSERNIEIVLSVKTKYDFNWIGIKRKIRKYFDRKIIEQKEQKTKISLGIRYCKWFDNKFNNENNEFVNDSYKGVI